MRDIENIEQAFNILTLKHCIRYNVNVENQKPTKFQCII